MFIAKITLIVKKILQDEGKIKMIKVKSSEPEKVLAIFNKNFLVPKSCFPVFKYIINEVVFWVLWR